MLTGEPIRRGEERQFFARFGRLVAGCILLAAALMLIAWYGFRPYAIYAIPMVLFILAWIPFAVLAHYGRDV